MIDPTIQNQMYVIKGVIAELPPEGQQRVYGLAEKIRELINADKDAGVFALALVSLDEQAKL